MTAARRGLDLNYVKAVIKVYSCVVRLKSTLHQGSCLSILLSEMALPLPVEEERQVKSQINGA